MTNSYRHSGKTTSEEKRIDQSKMNDPETLIAVAQILNMSKSAYTLTAMAAELEMDMKRRAYEAKVLARKLLEGTTDAASWEQNRHLPMLEAK